MTNFDTLVSKLSELFELEKADNPAQLETAYKRSFTLIGILFLAILFNISVYQLPSAVTG